VNLIDTIDGTIPAPVGVLVSRLATPAARLDAETGRNPSSVEARDHCPPDRQRPLLASLGEILDRWTGSKACRIKGS
jgi:hypothetical protein